MLEPQWEILFQAIKLEKWLKSTIIFLAQWLEVQLIANIGNDILLCNAEFINLEMEKRYQ